jgi:hypothetical protein
MVRQTVGSLTTLAGTGNENVALLIGRHIE